MKFIVNPQSNDDSSQQENNNQAEDIEFEDEFREEEVLKLCEEMDAINAALDKIEKQNDEINKQIRDFLRESAESKNTSEMQKTKDGNPNHS